VPRSSAVEVSASRTCWLVALGLALHTSAATPATCGVAIDVPSMYVYSLTLVCGTVVTLAVWPRALARSASPSAWSSVTAGMLDVTPSPKVAARTPSMLL